MSCEACQERLHDLATGQPVFHQKDRRDTNSPKIYRWGEPPPCRVGESCPKVSPEEAHKHELSDENWLTVELYYTHRETDWQFLVGADALTVRNLGIVGQIVRAHERGELLQALTRSLQSPQASPAPQNMSGERKVRRSRRAHR